MRTRWIATALLPMAALACSPPPDTSDAPSSEQSADAAFEPSVAQPAYVADGPRVLFDEAHNNYHTMSGRYRPFVDLLTLDGYRFLPNKIPFTEEVLRDVDALVIVNAFGGETEDDPDSILGLPAFREEEVEVVRAWVESGGSLLLVADHYPSGSAAGGLASAFGVDMRNSWTFDPANAEPGYGRYNIAYSRTNGLLADHPITRGRRREEQVDKVVAFTGQSLKGPPECAPLLVLSESAVDEDVTETIHLSAAGRVQGLAMPFGAGRLVVLGEAAMLTAQQRVRDGEVRRFGMNYEDSDNQQFALNVMHWLTGLLD